MKDITIQQIDGGLRLINGDIVIQATNIKGLHTRRYAELYAMRSDGSPLYLPQRIDILNQQDVSRFLANLSTIEPSMNWDTMLARLGVELAEFLDNTRKDQCIFQKDSNELADVVLSHRALLEMEITERKALVGFLAEGSLNMVYAARGRGKTRFALGLSMAVAQGEHFLGWECGHATGVLYIDGEMPLWGLRRIVEKMCPTPLDNMHVLASEHFFKTYDRDLKLTEVLHRNLIDRIIEQLLDVKLLVIDNISTLFPGISEDKKQDWEPINAWLIQLRHRGLAVLLVHHASKTGDQRGTSAREDILDNVINLKAPPNYDPEEGCHFYLNFTKARFTAGEAVRSLDVKCVENDKSISFEYQPVDDDYEQKVRDLLMDGITSPTEIANELSISKGYASKLKKRIEING